jgi:transcriptional regulator with XRE-family HTH domain
MRPSICDLVRRELKRRKWSMAELDRRAGLSIGETRRLLKDGRQLTLSKIEAILDALELVIRKR